MGDVFFGPVQTSPEKRKREAFENEDDVTVQLDSPSLATGAWGSSPANKTPVSAPVWRSSPLSNKSCECSVVARDTVPDLATVLVNLQTPKSEVKPSGPTEPKAYEDLLHLFSVRKSAKQSSAAKHNTLDTRFDTIPSPTAARSARDSPRLSLPVQEQPESAGNEGAAYDQDGTRPLDVGHTTEIQQHSDSAILDNNMVSPEKLPSPSRTSPEASTALNKLATHRVISEVPMHKQPKHSPEAASTPVAAEETIDASTSIPSFPTPQSKPTPANFVNTRRRQYTTASSKLPRAPFSRPQPAFQVSADASISKTPLLSASLSSSTSSSSSHGTASLVQPQLQQEKPKLPVKSKMPRPMHHHQSSGRPPTPASQQPHPSDGLERGTDPLSDPETTQQDSTIVEETAEEKPSRRKKTSLNTVKQVSWRSFSSFLNGPA